MSYIDATSTPEAHVQPADSELWLKLRTDLTHNSSKLKLPMLDEPESLKIQALTIARLAGKRKLELESVSGDTTRRFKVLKIGDAEELQEEALLGEGDFDSIQPGTQLSKLKAALNSVGWTLQEISNDLKNA
jgi:hypothetical protein